MQPQANQRAAGLATLGLANSKTRTGSVAASRTEIFEATFRRP